jgi:hypothetical protein
MFLRNFGIYLEVHTAFHSVEVQQLNRVRSDSCSKLVGDEVPSYQSYKPPSEEEQ